MTFPVQRLAPWQVAITIATIAGLPLAFFWPLVFTDAVLVDYDLFAYFYPYKEQVRLALGEGRFPLWNTLVFMGAPLFANVQTAILYPFNLATFWMQPPYQVNASIVLHTMLAGGLAFALGHHGLRLRWAGSMALALAWMFSGFMAQQTGHINQFNVTAWLPALILAVIVSARRFSLLATAAGAAVVCLQFLAGHTQELYLSLIAAGLTALWLGLRAIVTSRPWRRYQWRRPTLLLRAAAWPVLWPLVSVGLMAAVGLALSGAQLLPTLELSSVGARGGGLPFDEGRSFSLPPWQLLWAIFPGYLQNPFSEFIGFIGIAGLVLALVGLVLTPHRWARNWSVLLVVVSLFFALGGFNPLYEYVYDRIPGLNLFRVPARWLFLYTLGVAVLAALGADVLAGRGRLAIRAWPRFLRSPGRLLATALAVTAVATVVIVATARFSRLPDAPVPLIWLAGSLAGIALVLVALRYRRPALAGLAVAVLAADLFLASRSMPYNQPVPAEAWFRNGPVTQFLQSQDGWFRILSLAETRWIPAEEGATLERLSGQWPRQAIIDLLSSLKLKEVVATNVNMVTGLASIDGYDGGVLPYRRYILYKQQLFESAGTNRPGGVTVDPGQPDGILRFQLETIPAVDKLQAMGVRFVVADKIFDGSRDGVNYDLSLRTLLAPGESVTLPGVPGYLASHVDVVTHLRGDIPVADGTPVAEVEVTLQDGRTSRQVLRAGTDTAQGQWTDAAGHQQPERLTRWRNDPDAAHYATRVGLPGPGIVESVTVRSLFPQGTLVLQGASVLDQAARTSRTLIAQPPLTLAFDGDIKVYEIPDPQGLAYLTPNFAFRDTPGEIYELRGDHLTFTGLEGVGPQQLLLDRTEARGAVRVLEHQPERIILEAVLEETAALVVTDAWAPGWKATVNGQPASLYPANVLFKGMVLPAGTHRIEMRYEPDSLAWGIRLSLAGAAGLGLLLVGGIWQRNLRRASRTPWRHPGAPGQATPHAG